MPMNASEIVDLIKESLPQARVEITDLRGDNDHYAVVVASPAFVGKTRIQQHKMVYDALKGKMGEELHALSLQTIVETDQ